MGTYIIHFDDKPWEDLDDKLYYRCFEIPWFSTTKTTISRLTPYTEDSAYAHGYTEAESKYRETRDELEKQAYQRGHEAGLDDAWKAVRKIYDISHEDRLEIFPKASTFVVADICDRYSASEAIEKIRQYEQEKEEQITKGDIVRIKSTPEVEILVTYADEEYVSGIALTEVDGNCEIGDQYTNVGIHNVEKTGKHYDIVSVLQKMREESNG